jgi:hypothetical protein
MPGNQARGGTVTVRARFDKLGELAATLAEAAGCACGSCTPPP